MPRAQPGLAQAAPRVQIGRQDAAPLPAGRGREMMTAGGPAGLLAGQRFFAGVADAV